MGKYAKIIFWILAAGYLTVVFAFFSKEQKQTICSDIEIIFSDSLDEQYIDKDNILEILNSGNERIVGTPISNISISKLEKKLNESPFIKHAEVYKKTDDKITLEIDQRIPIIRIINSLNKSYYIGQDGILMPVSKKIQLRMVIANGDISFSPDFGTVTNIYDSTSDTINEIKTLKELHMLVNYINNDEFWQAQIQQIYITDKKEFELIPLVGNHIIQFGGIENLEEKFRNLEAIYKKGFPSKGWNQYSTLNVKYRNQVICGKTE